MINSNWKIIDTNIFVDWLMEVRSSDEMQIIFSEPVYLNYNILTELTNFLQNRYSHYHALESLNLILENPGQFLFLPVNDLLIFDAQKIMDKYQSAQYSWSDSLIIAQAEFYSLKVLTQDRKMTIYPNVSISNPFHD